MIKYVREIELREKEGEKEKEREREREYRTLRVYMSCQI